ncbi:MAG TPA: (Fe-S)-binding protein [Bacteroidales bacterium]|nr:(Fe-S)-binding protein [Bacteroidales bacterium]
MIPNIIFVLVLFVAVFLFYRKVRSISQEIKLGKPLEIKDHKAKRWKLVAKVAIGQSKMVSRPVAAIMHLFVYVGFIIVNIEMLEILIDGVFGTHRVFSFAGGIYPVLISSFEVFGLLVMFGCLIFLIRRNVIRVNRFWSKEMRLWPRSDANIILITELFLMSAILIMNATDGILQMRNDPHYLDVGSFLFSGLIQPLFAGMSDSRLIFIERFCWWFHIVGVLAFLNYIPYSKHFHMFLAFPNVYYSKLGPQSKIANMPSITSEIKMMLSGNMDMPAEGQAEEIGKFGSNDVRDFTWKHLMDAYTCSECGRCTSRCPANITGKKLSPRKVVMDVRDRLEVLGKNIRKSGTEFSDDKSLFDKITSEELWACTTCNACALECPVNIDPVAIIMEMRRYLVMEKAAAPAELNAIFSNIENNGAPWQYSAEDRLLWAKDLEINVS